MREIIFRGKSLVDEAWKYGYYTKIEDNYIRDGDFLNMVKPETVGQYTGLVDKNGVRIFEGDIVVDKQEHRVANVDPEYAALIEDDAGDIYSQIVFCEGAFMLLEPGYAPEVFLAGTEQEIEVVGNVFENKELLEVE